MKEQLDLVKILKDCPQGMPLDCAMFDNVTFVGVNNSREQFPIEIAVGGIRFKYLTKEGCFHDPTLLPESKCIIFPKGKTTWEGFQKLWTIQDAKEGDVLAINWYEGYDYWEKIVIFKKYHNEGANSPCVEGYGNTFKNRKLAFHEEVPRFSKTWTSYLELATKEQRDLLFQTIKEAGYKWNEETKTLDKLIEPKFKVGDIVYSTTWQQDVIIQEIFPDGFYKVSDLQCSGWFKTHEDALRKEKITLPIDSHLLTKQFKQEILLPEGYQFVDDNGNIINTKKIKLVKNAPTYPKSYEECCDVLSMDYATHYNLRYFTYERGFYEYATTDKLCSLQDKLNILGKLIICRNAYWKIAGEQMGLGKPWEPIWDDDDEDIFHIYTINGTVYSDGGYPATNKILVFPTEEMRDAFYRNFKYLIELCKELL